MFRLARSPQQGPHFFEGTDASVNNRLDQSRRPSARRKEPVKTFPAVRLAVGAVVAVLVVALAVVALNRADPVPRTARTAGAAGPVSDAGPARVGAPFPAFAVTTPEGKQITNAALSGRPALLWFTTSYCVPCQVGAKELAAYEREVLRETAPRVVFVFVDPSEPQEALLQFRDKFGLPSWDVALDADQLAQRAAVTALDTKIFLDGVGVVQDIDLAPVTDDYLDTVRRLSEKA